MGRLHDARAVASDSKRPLSVTHSAGKRSRVSTVRHDDTLVDSIPVAVSARRPAPAHECAVCERLQRNETDGKPDEHGTLFRADRLLMVLGDWYRVLPLEPRRGVTAGAARREPLRREPLRRETQR